MTYRDELEAEHARVAALEEKASALELENAELRAKSDAPHLPPAKRPRAGVESACSRVSAPRRSVGS